MSRCTTYFHIWTDFLRNWVQWVTNRGRDSIRTWKRWRPGIRVAWTQLWWLTTVGIWRDLPAAEHSRSSKKRKFKPSGLNNGEATCDLRVLTFINAYHSVYSNRCFYQVINICSWQNIFALKNIFRICVDKNQLRMLQKYNRFCHKIWFFFSNQLSTKTWLDGEKRMPFPDSAVQKYPKSVVEI